MLGLASASLAVVSTATEVVDRTITACCFGLDFEDKKLWSVRDGYRVYKSDQLEKLWPFGMSEIGSVTPESAGYVAGIA